jgi:lipid II:glycine glycyltransferase (peptidoglycan interpeptide bridge formation enzyme)
MRWEAIQWAKRHGYRWFDFGGIDPATAKALLTDQGADEAASNGSDRAKISFGGSVHVFPPTVELIASAPMRFAYDLARRSARGRRAVSAVSRRLRAPHVSRSGPGRTPE